ILRIEALCKDLYESTDATQRSQAQEALVAISNSDNCLTECQFLLEHSTSPYAQMFASQSLIKLISRTTSSLPLNHRLEMRNYLLNYLATRLKLTNFVAQALMKLLARITKYSWFEMQKEQYVFQTVVNDVMNKFLQGNSIDTCVIGIQILTNLIIEMNQVADPSRSFAKQRKVAASFRDSVLLDMFNVACSFLKQLTKKPVDQNNQEQVTLVSSLLQLTVQVLSFDFIGSCIDEASDDVSTVQIPTSWRQAFLDGSLLDLFFNLYGVFNSSLTALSLSCLVHLASVRRSLFNNNERPIYLNSLVQGIRSVLEKPQYLSDPSCYHEFCRLLARLKSNYQLGELVKVDNYSLVIDLIAKFTVTSVQVWQCAPNSVHYLLGLWQRFVASLPYVKSSSPHHLNEYSPQITKAYVTSRLESVQLVIRDGLEDPMEDYHVLEQQLEQLSTIARCDYDQTCSLVMSLFDQAASSYQECLQQQSQRSDASFVVYEGQLAWLVCIIGSVVAGRTLFYIAEESDILDGELICRYVLQLMKLLEERNPQVLSEKLDLAILSFFEQFRKIYIGDQMQKTAKVYSCIGERLGLKDESMVLSIFINKILSNLKYKSENELIMLHTLQLLNMSIIQHLLLFCLTVLNYSSVRKIVKLESIQFVLKNHTEQHFPFLGIQPNITLKNMRHRTLFYTAIGRFLMVDLGEDDESFVQFFMPLTLKFEQFKNQIASTSVNEEQVKRTIIGLCRDIRGLGTAFVNRSCYMMLFDWLYPAYMPALIRAVELWYHDPSLTTPVLKLVTEIVQNRSQRLQFEVSSPNGVLLFREVSKIICTYGKFATLLILLILSTILILLFDLKGISICFSMLKAALSGNYVNFGIFRLYGDDAFDNVLGMFLRMLLSIPSQDLLDYPKLGKAYYSLIEALAQDHASYINNLEPNVLLVILSTLSQGFVALDVNICTFCCSALDHLLTNLFKEISKTKKSNNTSQEQSSLLRVLEHKSEVLQQVLDTILNIIMFEDCKNQWTMSRPLLGLILLNEKYFSELTANIISSQHVNKQEKMSSCFSSLMDGVEFSLFTKNRERFAQNLSAFRRDVHTLLGASISLQPDNSTTANMMTS
ncbi:uncharacterized protein TRIADDRAFT_32548, partial [Trichoplax adhaerens]